MVLAGRKLPLSPGVPQRSYEAIRFKLWFYKGPLFYAAFNLRLFFYLLFSKADALFANDLDTLPANYLVSLIRKKFLVYDSHEYYTGVPELQHRPFIRSIWTFIEKYIFPKLPVIITVNDSIAGLYKKQYGKSLLVIRNVPLKPLLPAKVNKQELRKKLMLPEEKKILILQGSGINIHRGAEEAVEAMRYLDNVILIILGGGDVLHMLHGLVQRHKLHEKVIFKPRMPYVEMMEYTRASDLGLTFDKGTSINYQFSLPNKIFDYIHAGIPVLASRLPEVEKIITTYQIGDFIDDHNPEHIAEKIRTIFNNATAFDHWQKNLDIAASILNWEEESKKFPDIIHELS